MRIIAGNDLSKEDINAFNAVIRAAYSNKTSSLPDPVSPEDIHFFLEVDGDTVAVGRYVKVEGIKIGGARLARSSMGQIVYRCIAGALG